MPSIKKGVIMTESQNYTEKQTHELNERKLEYIESAYHGIGFAMCGAFIVGLILLISGVPITGGTLLIVAMLGFILRRLRIEGEKTRRKLDALIEQVGAEKKGSPDAAAF